MYKCGNPTAPVDKFHWFLLPLSEANTILAVPGNNRPGSRERKRSIGNEAGPYFMYVCVYLREGRENCTDDEMIECTEFRRRIFCLRLLRLLLG